MNYEEMSDFEINERVILTLFDGSENPIITKAFPSAGDSLVIASAARVKFYDDSITTIDFCKSPLDAWSIIVDNNIEITPNFNGSWKASCIKTYTFEEEPIYDNELCHSDKNPLRAAMICFLKMKESDNG